MSAPGGDPVARLTALASQLRGELDRQRAQATARLVTERATGMLMERLGCTAAEARQQLELLASRSGTTPADIAAEIAGEHLIAGEQAGGRSRRAEHRAGAAPSWPR